MMRSLQRAALLVLILGLIPTPLARAAPAADGIIHIVQPGENLFRIGLKYGVSWSAIMQANGLTSTNIYVGQQLTIPTNSMAGPAQWVSDDNPSSYNVVWGDTLASIALRVGVTTDELASANGLLANSEVYAGQILTLPGGAQPPVISPPGPANPALAPGPNSGAYVVQGGDTLSSIAQRYGLTTAALASANGLSMDSWVYSGQTLSIPGGGAAVVAEVPPAPGDGGSKRIVVDISDQRLYASQDGALLYNFIASTGEPGRETRPGNYSVLTKIPNAYGGTWNIWMPNWLGIYWAGSLQNGIHALPILPGGGRLWQGWLGTPVSYGCVILGVLDAQTLYDWAELGTPVTVQW